MDLRERIERQNFLGITAEDCENVRGLQKLFEAHAADFARDFYKHLQANPQTREFLRDPAQVERLKKLQVQYFRQLLTGVLDDDYFTTRQRVGQTHQRVGLEPVWYLGAYNLYIQLLFPQFVENLEDAANHADNLGVALPRLLSLLKLIFLDIGLTLETYFDQATEQLQHRNEELKRALELYWQSQNREEQLRRLVSHEVRGGLAAMITSLEDLREVVHPALQRDALDQFDNVLQRCWSLANLLKDMLQKSPADGPSRVDCREIFDTLRARFSLYTGGRAVRLHLPEEPPVVWADATLLREALANLVSNAVRYLDKEPGEVSIHCRDQGDFELFCVADNGPGFPDYVQANLFQPFVRGPSKPGVSDGMGLGLCFVRNVIVQGGGKIWVESNPGKGSKVWFTVKKTA